MIDCNDCSTLGKNPFRPVAWAPRRLSRGRDQSLRRFRSVVRAAPEQPANVRLTGLRGVGKTVLLREFRRGGADGRLGGLRSSSCSRAHNTDDAIAEALGAALKATREEVSRVERLKAVVGGATRKAGTLGIGWGEFQMTYQPGVSPEREDLSRALFETVESVIEHGRNGVILLLDEAR